MMWWRLFSFSAFRAGTLLVLFVSLAASPCGARVGINEIYYDHPGTDDGWEFVEIYNDGESACDVSGWRLEFLDGASGNGRTLWTAPSGMLVGPHGLICVSGSARHPASEFLIKGAIGNGPDAVRLVSPAGVVDVIGYGDVTLPDLYESAPAPDVAPGLSLARKPDGCDTDRNSVDFAPSAPTPGGRNYFLRDVTIAIEGSGILPCRGSSFSFIVKVTNCGIERMSGEISILSAAIAQGTVPSSDSAFFPLDLSPSAAESIAVTLTSPLASRFDVRAVMTAAIDENAANDTALTHVGSSPGAVVLSEIMYRPREGRCEWIELVNTSAATENLKSWTVCDATGSKRLISDDDLFISPDGFLILAQDSASFRSAYPGCGAPVRSLVKGWPALNDADRGSAADRVELYDRDGVLVERASYTNLVGTERGWSIERVSPQACSSLAGGIWHRCAARGGSTPGAENSTRTVRMPSEGGTSISPNPFCPQRDRETVITSTYGEGETGFLVRIFNLDGREVRRIFGEKGGARVFSCRWDGRTNEGTRVRTGLYVCLVEIMSTGGGVCRREKECLAVAAD